MYREKVDQEDCRKCSALEEQLNKVKAKLALEIADRKKFVLHPKTDCSFAGSGKCRACGQSAHVYLKHKYCTGQIVVKRSWWFFGEAEKTQLCPNQEHVHLHCNCCSADWLEQMAT